MLANGAPSADLTNTGLQGGVLAALAHEPFQRFFQCGKPLKRLSQGSVGFSPA